MISFFFKALSIAMYQGKKRNLVSSALWGGGGKLKLIIGGFYLHVKVAKINKY